MQDIPEHRRRFKQVLVERQVGEGMELPGIDQRQLHDFMNPNDKDLKLQRSEELLELTTAHLAQTEDFAQAQRQSVLQLFHKEAPFRQVRMDESYFKNREFVEADLRGFLVQAKGDSLVNLSTGNPKYSAPVVATQNGEQVKWETYLKRASGVLLGTKQGNERKKTDNPHRKVYALKALLKIAGIDIPEYIPMDEAYFNNPGYVKADLALYLKYAKGESFECLNTSNPKLSTKIRTRSGEQVRWETYLDRASDVLLATKSRGDNPRRPLDALNELLKIISVVVPEYIPMDEKYFSNFEYVKADLTSYLQCAKGESFECLNTKNPKYSTSIQTQSGEQVTWNTYLSRASSVLLGTKDVRKSKNPSRRPEALKKLIEIATQISDSPNPVATK